MSLEADLAAEAKSLLLRIEQLPDEECFRLLSLIIDDIAEMASERIRVDTSPVVEMPVVVEMKMIPNYLRLVKK